MPEEIKQRISKTLKGRKFSEETLRKMSVASKGRVFSEETRKKLSDARKGTSISFSNPEERGEKISCAMKDRNFEHPEIMQKMRDEATKKCSKKVAQKDLDGTVIAVWKSAAEIERVLGVNHVQISRRCHNPGKPLCGFLWEFYDK